MANEKNKVKFDTKGLDDILRTFDKEYTVRVGILGSKAKQTHDGKSGLTNADIGTFHEFGTKKMPRRSFLEDAIKFKMDFSESGMKPIKKKLFKNLFVKYKPITFFQDLGAKAVEVVEEAFETNGFGMWKPLSMPTIMRRANKRKTKKAREEAIHYQNILTDTGKLRHSISFKVVQKQK